MGGVEILCFTIKFLKDLAKAEKSKQYSLENLPKYLVSNPNCDVNSVEYINPFVTKVKPYNFLCKNCHILLTKA